MCGSRPRPGTKHRWTPSSIGWASAGGSVHRGAALQPLAVSGAPRFVPVADDGRLLLRMFAALGGVPREVLREHADGGNPARGLRPWTTPFSRRDPVAHR